MTTVYLDHAASTPLRAEALDAMVAQLAGSFGNPSGGHAVARRARQTVEEARDAVAGVLGCAPAEVIFTSGGTEADNLAVGGVTAARGGVPVCTSIEHHAVLHAVEAAGGAVVGVDATGAVDLDDLTAALERLDRVSVVSVIAAGNETGRVQDLGAVAEVVARVVPGTPLHTDAVQAAPWFDLHEVAACAHLISVAAHKLGGPKGTGCLVAREGTPVRPILHGGGQERERRSGTHDVAGIAGFAAALVATAAERVELGARVRVLRDDLLDRLGASVPGVRETTPDRSVLLPGHAHVLVEGCDSEELLVLLDDAGVCAAAGSSCASGATEPSHVLLAMGLPKHEAATALRLTVGRTTTDADIAHAVAAIAAAAGRLRGI
jgi:cysteine desulfurase